MCLVNSRVYFSEPGDVMLAITASGELLPNIDYAFQAELSVPGTESPFITLNSVLFEDCKRWLKSRRIQIRQFIFRILQFVKSRLNEVIGRDAASRGLVELDIFQLTPDEGVHRRGS